MKTNDHILNSAPVDSYGATISRFMNWAAERIAKEVEDNERLVRETGTGNWVNEYTPKTWQHFTEDEKIQLLKKVELLRAEGRKVKDACKTVGIHDSSYYKWKKEYNK